MTAPPTCPRCEALIAALEEALGCIDNILEGGDYVCEERNQKDWAERRTKVAAALENAKKEGP